MKRVIAVLVLFLAVGVITAGAADKKTVKEDGLVAYWSFDEGKGTAVKDLSGNGNNLEIENQWTKGKVGSALLFEGNDSIISIEDQENFTFENGFSIMAWIKVNDESDYQSVFNNCQFFLRKDAPEEGGKLSIFLSSSSCEPRASTIDALETDKWYCAAATWNGKDLKIYLDGVFQSQQERSDMLCDAVTATIGGGQLGSTNTNGWKGAIDELKIYRKALTEKQIKEYYDSTKKDSAKK